VLDGISPCEEVNIVCFKDLLNNPPIKIFHDWIVDQATVFERKFNLDKLFKPTP